MKDMMGIVFTHTHNDDDLKELTKTRAPASVPFGGRYRIVDFPLSSMVNSGITKVGIITRENYHSLMDHIGARKEWGLARMHDGLFFLPPFARATDFNFSIYRGKMEALFNAITFIKRSVNKYVLMSDANLIFNIDYSDALDFHVKQGADITVVCKKISPDCNYIKSNFLTLNTEGRMTNLSIGLDIEKTCNLSTNIYIISRELLLNLILECASHNLYNFDIDVLLRLKHNLKIYAYFHNGYMAKIDSISRFYQANMDLLNANIRSELFSQRPVYTKIHDAAPSYYSNDSAVVNSLLADGCMIEGKVENSIISRGVKVEKGAIVRNSIIMQDGVIQAGADVNYMIADKGAVITKDRTLTGYQSYPIVLAKGTIV